MSNRALEFFFTLALGVLIGLVLSSGVLFVIANAPDKSHALEICKTDGSGDCAEIGREDLRGQYTKGYLDGALGVASDPWSGYSVEERTEVGHAGEWAYAAGRHDGERGVSFDPLRHAR